MQDSNEIPSPRESATQLEQNNVRMTGAALARRSALLKGLGRGSAIIAAVTPIKTLAITNSVTQNGQVCTASGVGSAAHSTSTSLPTCGGLSPGYYKTQSHWPYYTSYDDNDSTKYKSTFTVGTKTVTVKFTNAPNGSTPGNADDTAFSAVFGGGSSNGMFYILRNQENTGEFHWIAALLNAVLYAATGSWPKSPYVYPYSPTEILNLYATNPVGGLAFIKNFMETL